ncbi:MAG TPA: response regulator [Myxococcota bacterium]|jgi:two-component system chemotaxis response regulator CheY|nr:response regulator [Myxococcota bacterium]
MRVQHRILIVEDSSTIRQLLGFALKRIKGAEIVEANDGLEGLRRLTAEPFDIALVDLQMPVMDGLKLIQAIRAKPDFADMPIVVVTAESAQEERARALALGANEYLTKPIQSNQVVAVVRGLLKIDPQE